MIFSFLCLRRPYFFEHLIWAFGPRESRSPRRCFGGAPSRAHLVILGGAFRGVGQVVFDGVENPWNFDGHSSLARFSRELKEGVVSRVFPGPVWKISRVFPGAFHGCFHGGFHGGFPGGFHGGLHGGFSRRFSGRAPRPFCRAALRETCDFIFHVSLLRTVQPER